MPTGPHGEKRPADPIASAEQARPEEGNGRQAEEVKLMHYPRVVAVAFANRNC